ncbi:egg cell-secreted protein 1.4-like [Elaeis guineensis]|uniref:Egg cell-secreted protein 1.4-like n=1 Tax=Elaeis guineensis var. tenera TaxID=51953 RepID=A0A6I9S7H6_ELAGV|nr:egg cell-secreted protein 1.4-like [Elaeis guineensis]
MALLKLLLPILLLASNLWAMSILSEARPGPVNIAARLQADEVKQCWDSLMELKSCTGEVILFFINGETYLGPGCCRAIRIIEHQCWAADAMLAALGFTAEEGDVLRGYCDDASDSSPPPLPLVNLDLPPPSPVSEVLVH